MATLTDQDYTQIRQLVMNDVTARGIVKTWSLQRSTFMALFQACETWNTDGFGTRPATSYKAAMDAVTSTTVQQSKMIWVIWSRWKAPQII